MACSWTKLPLGRSGLVVTPLGLGSSYGLGAADVERACERGVNYLYWGSIRTEAFGRGVRTVAQRRRDELVVVVQSYTRFASLLPRAVDSALAKLDVGYVDVLLLGWWNRLPSRRILDAALALREAGKVRQLMVSCHHRPSFAALAAEPALSAVMVRYNAAHPGAESEVFPRLGAAPPGVVAYTATRWGTLCDPRLMPAGEPVPRGSDCYRFALSHPSVNLCLAGPKNAAELDDALTALDRGPMSEDELAWMRRVGRAVHDAPVRRALPSLANLAERAGRLLGRG